MGDKAAAPQLSISLVVPLRDEEGSVELLIRSILGQTLLPSEIILVDAGSKDSTVELTCRLTAGNSRFRIIEAGPAWPGRARNIGVQAARCEWVAFTDAGIILDRDWLRELSRKIEQDRSVDVVYGNFEPQIETMIDRWAVLTWVPPLQEHGGGLMRGPVIPSSLIRKKVIEDAGGFPDFRASEDLVLMEEIEKRGARIGWQPTAIVRWSLPSTLGRTFSRFRLYSRHNVYAGRQRFWHYGVLRTYFVLLILGLGLSFSLGLRWALLGVAVAFLLRAAKSLWVRRSGVSAALFCNPLNWIGVVVLLLVLDAATFIGWIEATAHNPNQNS